MRGRKPTPTAMKLVKGTRPGRVNLQEPVFAGAVPDPPDFLGAIGLAEWERITGLLEDAGVLTPGDWDQVAAYCFEHEKVWGLRLLVAEEGEVVTGATGGPIRNPNGTALDSASKRLHQARLELGLSPVARSRVIASPKPKESRWKEQA